MICESKQPLISTILVAAVVLTSEMTLAGEPELRKTRQELLILHNQERSKEDLKPLKESPELTKAAQTYAEYLAMSGEFSHTAKGTPKSRREDAGYEGKSGGENIAKGQPTASEAFKSWLGLKTHEENILRDDFSEVGLGIARDENGDILWVVDFGSR